MRPSVNSAAIRRLNLIRIFHALREHPNCSQRDLVQRTGLDKATTSAIVAQLMDEGLVTRSDSGAPAVRRARRVGRPETALAIDPAAGLLVGARLEPVTIRILTATLAGTVLGQMQIAGSRDIGEALRRLHEGIDRAVAASGGGRPVRGIGIGLPGLMDRSGRLVLAPNLGWRDAPILPLLQEALDAPVYVDNDTKAAALAERLFGACRTVEDYLYVTGHSGVGGGLFLGGRLYRGAAGFAGELGHVTVVADGAPCGCGKRGCLEAYVSESAIVRRLADQGRAFADLGEVAAAAAAGDGAVRALLEEVGGHLGLALSHVANLLNPSLAVFGGSLSLVAEWVLPAVERAIDRHTLAPPRQGLRLMVSPLGADAVPIGGIALALTGFLDAHDNVRPLLHA